MVDLVIRGGTVVDGSGAPRRRADVAIEAGRVTQVGELSERGAREMSLVNGRPVLERGHAVERPAGERPGQVLRHFDS